MRLYRCDQCDFESTDDLAYHVYQTTDEVDDHGDPVVATIHLCSTGCFATYAMSLEIEHPD